MKPNIFVFDVESISLHGFGFAVGAVVQNRGGTEVDRFELLAEQGLAVANDWVKQNVIPHLMDMPKCISILSLRRSFFEFYIKHRESCEIWADCAYPVETNFLEQCFMDYPKEREWLMPFPLMDITSLVHIDIDRTAGCGIAGLRKHNPLDDSRASAYFLLKALELNLNKTHRYP